MMREGALRLTRLSALVGSRGTWNPSEAPGGPVTVSPDGDRYPQAKRSISSDVAKAISGLLMSPDMGGGLHAPPSPDTTRGPGTR